MSLKQEINRFSEESQQLLADMNRTEIFELCENSAKHQCPDCNAFSGNHPTILSRGHEQEDYQKSLAEHNIGEKKSHAFRSRRC